MNSLNEQRWPVMRTLVRDAYSAPLADDDLHAYLAQALPPVTAGLAPGARIALTAGSRGIDGYDRVLAATVAWLKQADFAPFIFPAMGSHGGATAEGQREVLATLGITEATMGCPIHSSMEVVELGQTDHGVTVYLDRYAADADAIIAVNRIKAHTNFRGAVESGLAKMLAIGAGKHAQALAIHAYGVDGLKIHMPQVAAQVMAKAPVIAGIGLLEDGAHHLTEVYVVPAAELLSREAELLERSKQWLPRLPVQQCDILIVDQIGKDISGTGMDTNVTGRCRLLISSVFRSPRLLSSLPVV